MPNTKKLLSITNLKKYFPIAKSSIFQKEQYYVHANEDITLDIYEGETLGIVGESGCGKSTLGRVLLQLYDQTAGTSMYYGRTRASVAPHYVKDTLKNADRYLAKIEKAKQNKEKAAAAIGAHAEMYNAKIEAAKKENKDSVVKKLTEKRDSAAFLDQQSLTIAEAKEKTQIASVVKLLGGFMVENTAQGASLLLKKTELEEQKAKLEYHVEDINLRISGLQESGKHPEKITDYQKELDSIREKEQELDRQIKEMDVQIEEAKRPYLSNPKFMEYEAMLDEGIDLSRLRYSEMRLLRKDIQIIFQDPYSSLNPRMTVGQIIEEGLVTHKYFNKRSEKMKDYILSVMRQCGLQDYMLHRYPHQFSGGQRQRISIARALAVKPKFVVCDECVSALDVSIQSQIINLLDELKEKDNLTYMFISHDLSVVRYISDRICVMYLGNVVELSDADTIFNDPRHPYTVALLSSIPTTDPDSLDKERILLEGNIPSPIRPPKGCKFHTRCYMACDKCRHEVPELQEITPGHFVACHFPEKKLDEQGNYLFDIPETSLKVRRSPVE